VSLKVGSTMTSQRVAAAEMVLLSAAESVLRAGGSIAFDDDVDRALYAAIDVAGDAEWRRWIEAGASTAVILTAARASRLGIVSRRDGCLVIPLQSGDDVEALAGCRDGVVGPLARHSYPAGGAAEAAVSLAKQAGLLPAVLQLAGGVPASPTLRLSRVDLVRATETVTDPLALGVAVQLPIPGTSSSRLFAFRGATEPAEHLALVIGDVGGPDAPLCRIHSECLTGDVFGSLRCDCGQQLRSALSLMAAAGAGVLLYLRQEGRGIGLLNKLRAYELQERGLDTVDANTHLGFRDDERDFSLAAAMLRQLDVTRVRLLTNNPDKLTVLERHGVTIVEHISHCVPANEHNRAYLHAKATRSGHLLRDLVAAAARPLPVAT
jgi:GTP cyclohydrolase II